MDSMKGVLSGSVLFRVVCALCLWFDGQWRGSRAVQWFLHPRAGDRAAEHSVFFKLWSWLRRGGCWLYRVLHLERLLAGSIFLQSGLWCAAAVVLAPLLPTMAVLGLSLVGGLSLLVNLLRAPARQLRHAPIHPYVLLYAGVYLAGTLFSVTLQGSLKAGALSVCFILFALVLVNVINDRAQLDRLLFLMVFAAAVVSLYGICQFVFGWGYQSAAWVDSDMFSTISFRVPSTLQNPNMLGQYLILMIPLGGAGLLSAKDWGRRALWLGLCGVMCLCMILTFSRGAWLGLLFAGVVFALLLSPKLILLAPVALVGLYFLLPETVISRFTSIGDLSDNSTSYRVYIWLGVLAMLKDFWLCGIGPGDAAFNLVYPAYSYNAVVAPHAHNLFLQMICDGGIVALVVFLLVLFVYFRTLCAAIAKERNQKSRIFQIAATAGVVGFLVQAMTDYSFYNYRVMFLFWAYLALGCVLARRSELPEGRQWP